MTPDRESPTLLDETYATALATPSDINQLLPTLRQYASNCERVTEFGTRSGVSTRAFLHARPQQLVCYDRVRKPEVAEELERLALDGGVQFEFIEADVLAVDIQPTDMLFIDTWHTGEQLAAELGRHAGRVRRYIAMHDTISFGEKGATPGHKGLWPAIIDFLLKHPEWALVEQRIISHGLTILGRRS